MKKLIIAALLLVTGAASAQKRSNVVLNKETGNFHAVTAQRDTAAATGRYYVDRAGSMWPVFRSPQGRLFALRTSKNGKVYRYYLKPDADTLDWEGN